MKNITSTQKERNVILENIHFTCIQMPNSVIVFFFFSQFCSYTALALHFYLRIYWPEQTIRTFFSFRSGHFQVK